MKEKYKRDDTIGVSGGIESMENYGRIVGILDHPSL
jgi:hypothetical protein